MGRRVSAVIEAVGHYVPERVVTSAEIEERHQLNSRLGVPAGLIERLSGVRERRYCENGESSSGLAARAGQVCLDRAGMDASEIDLLIFAAVSQDIGEPATANLVQHELGARRAHVFDVKNACNAFLNAMDIADSYIATGRCEVVLIVSGEVLSKFVRQDIQSQDDLRLGFASLTLGDGAGAMLLKRREDSDRGIQAGCFVSDGSQWEVAVMRAWGVMFDSMDPENYYFVSDGDKLQDLAGETLPDVIRQTLQKSGWAPQDLQLIVPHQVSIRLIRKISKMVGLPFERCMVTIDRMGNTAAASIPMALALAYESGRLHPGDRVLLAGGASGFSGAAVSLIW
ncbi:MAG: ketoacyl-ACP synthase III [Planctomycetes bacterium]|nr:ketoacyl-ACP synthase III [Planctomycetota bacterium]